MKGETPRADLEKALSALPIFPLPGALLLPRGELPLNVFEPRYLNMVDDALKAARLIGMVQPVRPERDPVSDDAELYHVGCAGRITAFSETADGRYLITLTGLARFRIDAELAANRGYRRVSARLAEFADDLMEGAGHMTDRERLLRNVREYFKVKSFDVDWSSVDEIDDEALITAISMVCPFEPGEKQALLESPSLETRAELLATLVEMALSDGASSPTVARH